MNNNIREQAIVIKDQEDKIYDLQEELRTQKILLNEILNKMKI